MMHIIPIFIIMFIAIYVFLGTYVYRDAGQRGMNKLLWTLVVILVPSFLGLVIYLLIRNSEQLEEGCPNCKKPIRDDFEVCPYCAFTLTAKCEGCDKNVSIKWGICPWCKRELPGGLEKTGLGNKKNRKKNNLVTVIILSILIMLFAIMALFIIRGVSSAKEFYFMAHENNTSSSCSKHYQYFDGTSTRDFSLEKGQSVTIKIDSIVKKGELTIEIDDSKGNVLKYINGGSSEIVTITAEKDEAYKIKAKGINTKGSFDISWNKSGS